MAGVVKLSRRIEVLSFIMLTPLRLALLVRIITLLARLATLVVVGVRTATDVGCVTPEPSTCRRVPVTVRLLGSLPSTDDNDPSTPSIYPIIVLRRVNSLLNKAIKVNAPSSVEAAAVSVTPKTATLAGIGLPASLEISISVPITTSPLSTSSPAAGLIIFPSLSAICITWKVFPRRH